jgi:hypothetical protein
MGRRPLIFGELIGPSVQGTALQLEHAAANLEVVAEAFSDEIRGIGVARLEVNGIDILACGAIDDPADAGPDTG